MQAVMSPGLRNGGYLASIRLNFSSNLDTLLKKRGLSQRDFAKKVDVGESVVSRWVNGESLPRERQWDKIADVLGATYVELVKEPGTKQDSLTELLQEISSKVNDLMKKI